MERKGCDKTERPIPVFLWRDRENPWKCQWR